MIIVRSGRIVKNNVRPSAAESYKNSKTIFGQPGVHATPLAQLCLLTGWPARLPATTLLRRPLLWACCLARRIWPAARAAYWGTVSGQAGTIVAGLGQYWDNTGAVLGHYWDSTGTILGQYWDVLSKPTD